MDDRVSEAESERGVNLSCHERRVERVENGSNGWRSKGGGDECCMEIVIDNMCRGPASKASRVRDNSEYLRRGHMYFPGGTQLRELFLEVDLDTFLPVSEGPRADKAVRLRGVSECVVAGRLNLTNLHVCTSRKRLFEERLVHIGLEQEIQHNVGRRDAGSDYTAGCSLAARL